MNFSLGIFKDMDSMASFRKDAELFLGKVNVVVACRLGDVTHKDPYRKELNGIVLLTIKPKSNKQLLTLMMNLRTSYLTHNDALVWHKSKRATRPYKERIRYIKAFERLAKSLDRELKRRYINGESYD
jgi:hypothetical protein